MKDGKIKKCVLVDGKFDSGRPKPGDTVLVKVQGKLKDGTIVDDYPTLVFTIGEYEVIDGLDLVVQSMYRNELSIVSIKPEMAYGEQGKNARNLKKLREFERNLKKLRKFENSLDAGIQDRRTSISIELKVEQPLRR